MTDHADLIARMEEIANRPDCTYPGHMLDAAMIIKALVRERDEALRLYHAEAETAHAEMDRADRAEAEVERLRDALRLVRATIIAAPRDVLTDTLWLTDSLSETAVDCINAALATEDKP